MTELHRISAPAGLLQSVVQFTRRIIGYRYESGQPDRPTTEPRCL